jgi:MoxR-like ATPase
MNDVPAALSDPEGPTGDSADDLSDVIERYSGRIEQLKAEVGRIFIGPDRTIEALLVALLAQGHVLLEGVPGVAKTTLVRAFAQTLDADFNRIQFTPDLLPSDITGTYVPNLQTNEFSLRRGPIFANIVLGDEINRAPAKTQSALLEAMQERQVTIDGTTHELEAPFLVLATQNPVEQEGVYALPEAQLDRFLLKVAIGYPTPDQEFRVMKTHQSAPAPVEGVLNTDDIAVLRRVTEMVHISDELIRYIVSLATFTREHDHTSLGASPRAALALLQGSKARAVIRGRAYVLPDDVRILAPSVLSHRVLLLPEAQLGQLRSRDVVAQALKQVPYSD